MIEKSLLSPIKSVIFSSISNKLSLDTTTISLVLLLSDFSSLHVDLFCLGIRPFGCYSCQQTFERQKTLVKF